MKKNSLTFCALIVFTTITRAQFSDNFSDGNFTNDPAWTTPAGDWIVNSAGQLQSNNTTANSTFYISTPSSLATVAQWEFYVQLAFNTSSSNYADVFVTASSNDLAAADGYFVRIGYTTDEISLYKKSGGSIVKLIDGIDGTTNNSNNTARIKVTRDGTNAWKLYRDLTGSNNYFLEGSATDNAFSTSSFFGILVKQSTVASFAQKHFFDDIVGQVYVPDLTPPGIVSVTATSDTTLGILFNESVDPISSQVAANYTANNGIGSPLTAVADAANTSQVHLFFSRAFPNGSNNTLTVNGVEDANGNALTNGNADFIFYKPQPYDIVIDELMADPSPQVALPNTEWIELKNTSLFPIQLTGWKLQCGSSISSPFPAIIVMPDSFIIVCSTGSAALLSAYGKTLPLNNFPPIDNSGELVSLTNEPGNIIHSLIYNSGWYKNELKQDGGWTLEMIDTKNPCSGSSNWTASINEKGGTPGTKNSVEKTNADETQPRLLRAYTTDSITLVLVFDEPLLYSTASVNTNYSVSDGVGIPLSAIPSAPVFDKVVLQLSSPLAHAKTYSVTAAGVSDCSGNNIAAYKTARAGLGERADSFDIVLNEILFNPPSNGYDYLEIYNRSNKIIDLQQIRIANRNTTGSVGSITSLSSVPYLFFPGDYVVITENADWIKANFITKDPTAFITPASVPSYNDDAGDVIVLGAQGNIIDELKYKSDWHFKLLSNTEGVALERIDYSEPTQQEANWHSAASSVNYGTPTYQNSQFKINEGVQGEIELSPGIVSPDNDGQDDFAGINYHFPQPGYMATATIFDAAGRPVRYLLRNVLCGTSGSFRWDGLGELHQQLPSGVYIILVEVFNLEGKRKQFKKPIVVARKA